MALEKEIAAFNQRLPEFQAQHEGKFVLIHGDDFIDAYSTYEDAIKAGYKAFGLEPFLVKQVLALEQAQFISRFVEPHAVGA